MSFQFDAFVLDGGRRQLLKSGVEVRLSPKALDLLGLLVASRPRALSKAEIYRHVWPGTHVSDATLASVVNEIRQALGDSTESPTYIRTVHRFGYAFAAEATEDRADTVFAGEATGAAGKVAREHRAHQRTAAALLCLGLLIGGGVTWWWWTSGHTPGNEAPQRYRSVAVMPFVVEGTVADDSRLWADAISEELIRQLANQPGLRVISWTTARRYADSSMSSQERARTLRVDALVEGGFLRVGDRIRVSVSLTDGKTGGVVWSESFDQQFTDLFDVQRRVAVGAAAGLLGSVTPDARARLGRAGSRSVEAYELYLRGRSKIQREGANDPAAVELALSLFRSALKRDPDMAAAHAGIGSALFQRYYRGWSADLGDLVTAEAECWTALRLDPQLSWASLQLGNILAIRGATLSELLALGQLVAESGAADDDALAALAATFGLVDDDLTVAIQERRWQSDSANIGSGTSTMGSLCETKRYARALEVAESLRAVPGVVSNPRWHLQRGIALHCLGRAEEASREYADVVRLGFDNYSWSARVYAGVLLKRSGTWDDARETWRGGLDGMDRLAFSRAGMQHAMKAVYYAYLGDRSASDRETRLVPANALPQDIARVAQAAAVFGNFAEAAHILSRLLAEGHELITTWVVKSCPEAVGLESFYASPEFRSVWADWEARTAQFRRQFATDALRQRLAAFPLP